MDFEKQVCIYGEFNEVRVSYGIESGSENILFIKSGRGGDHRGYGDKYVKIAKEMNEKYGCTVICASNPEGDPELFCSDMEFIDKYAAEQGFLEYGIYFMGNSNGANLGLWAGKDFPKIKRMLLVNMPLMINFHKTVKAIKELDNIPKTFVYGSLDPSRGYIPYLELQNQKNMEIKLYDGADHNFKGKESLFGELPHFLFTSDDNE